MSGADDGVLAARLHAIAASLDDLGARISAVVEEQDRGYRDDAVIGALEEVERQVRNASRRLDRLRRELERRK